MVGAAVIQLLGVGLGAIVVALTMRAAPVVAAALVRSPGRRERLARYGPAAELMGWALYLAAAGVWLWNRDVEDQGARAIVALAAVLIAVALAGGWRTFRDYLAGVVVRSEGSWKVGDRVLVGEVEGRVVGLGYRTVQLQRRDGDLVFVPYSRLSTDVLVRRHAEGDVVRHTFTVDCPRETSPSDLVPRLREAALLHHWSSPGHDPEVRVSPDGVLEVTIHALSEARVSQVEHTVRGAVSEPAAP